MSGLAISPAHAVAPSDGAYVCTTGVRKTTESTSTYTISSGVVRGADFLSTPCDGAVVIPEGVTSIDADAFESGALTSITIPASVTTIGNEAFANATLLTSINFALGSQLTSIGGLAFYHVAALTSINIPASVTTIGNEAFANATLLTSITADSNNQSFTSIDGALFDKAATTLIQYPLGKSDVLYSIPASVTIIGDSAFAYSSTLTFITIPASVTSIEGAAFFATKLASITIPASVTTIGPVAFMAATSLNSVYFLGNAPTSVGDMSFLGVATGAKAYVSATATGFGTALTWNGLVVTVGVYKVTYNTTGGSLITAQNYITNFPAPASPTRTDYTFAGWSATAGGSVITWPNTPASGIDITLYAKWTRNSTKAVATVKPSVSGTPKVSKMLTAKKGTWTGYPTPAFTYHWYACTKKVTAAQDTVPSTCKKITGTTKSTLKLVKAQKGKFISVLVTGNGTGTSATKWLSKSTAKVK